MLCKFLATSDYFSCKLTSNRRIGFGQLQEKTVVNLLPSVEDLLQCWDVLENQPTAPAFDFMWNATVEEGREKQLLQQAFTTSLADTPALPYSTSDEVCVAESALKVMRILASTWLTLFNFN